MSQFKHQRRPFLHTQSETANVERCQDALRSSSLNRHGRSGLLRSFLRRFRASKSCQGRGTQKEKYNNLPKREIFMRSRFATSYPKFAIFAIFNKTLSNLASVQAANSPQTSIDQTSLKTRFGKSSGDFRPRLAAVTTTSFLNGCCC